MAISSPGIGSGLDVNSIITKLMAVEQQPALLLQKKGQDLSTKLSAVGQLKSVLSSVQDAAKALSGAEKYSATSARVSDAAALSATSNSTAAAGVYSVKVLALAQTQRVVSAAGATPAVGAGTLTIQRGTYVTDPGSGTVSFTPSATAAKPISFTGSTLAELRDAINASDSTLKASIVNDGTANRLVIEGSGTGADNAFKISGTDALAGLSYDASTGATNTFDRTQQAQDSRAEVQGITVTRSNNTVTDAIAGVTLNLTAVTAAPVSVTVSRDLSPATSAVQTLVKQFNGAVSAINAMTSYDPETKAVGPLNGDASARAAKNQLRAALTQSVTLADGSSMRLSDIGVTLQKDGTLAVDSTKLTKALTDTPARVAEFLGGTTSAKGLGGLVDKTLDGLIGTNGTVVGKADGLNSSIKSIDKQLEAWSTRLAATEQRYRNQFTRLDTTISSLTQTSTWLTQQLASLPGMSSK